MNFGHDDSICYGDGHIKQPFDMSIINNVIAFTDEIISSCCETICDQFDIVIVTTDAALSILDDHINTYVDRKAIETDRLIDRLKGDSDSCLCAAINSIDHTLQLLAEKQSAQKESNGNVFVSLTDNDDNKSVPVDRGTAKDENKLEYPKDSKWYVVKNTDFGFYAITNLPLESHEKNLDRLGTWSNLDDAIKDGEQFARYSFPDVTDVKLVKSESKDGIQFHRFLVTREGGKSSNPVLVDIESKGKEFNLNDFGEFKSLDWTSPNICEIVNRWVSGKSGIPNNVISSMFGFSDSSGKYKIPQWIEDIRTSVPVIGNIIASGLLLAIGFPSRTLDALTNQLFQAAGCDLGAAKRPIFDHVLLGLAGKWLGIDIPKVQENITKAIDTACPTMLPNVNELDDAFLSGTIKYEEWKCLVRANNSIPERRDPVLTGKRTRQSTYELLQLRLRDKITDEELNDAMREIGWITAKERNLQKELAWQTPSPSDLIPWMLRDVFDDTVVKEFGLDDEFQAKYTAKAKEFYKAAGIRDDIARYHWMAHWVNPSNTALFEMYHRLRGGDKKTGIFRYFDKNGNKLPVPIELTQDDIKVTEEQVARAIGVNDLSPFWRDKMLAISRPPLTRTDLRRAFEIDAINESELYEGFRDLGYSDENAGVLVRFFIQQKGIKDVRRKGRILPSRIAIMYEQQSITKDEAALLLKDSGLSETDIEATLFAAAAKAKAKTRLNCIKSLRKRYMYGDIDESQILNKLISVGVSMDQAIEILASLKCELAAKHKEATATMLCKWYGQGLITNESYKTRLLRIGYTKEDVDRIIKSCEKDMEEKTAKKSKASKEKDESTPKAENPAEKGK